MKKNQMGANEKPKKGQEMLTTSKWSSNQNEIKWNKKKHRITNFLTVHWLLPRPSFFFFKCHSTPEKFSVSNMSTKRTEFSKRKSSSFSSISNFINSVVLVSWVVTFKCVKHNSICNLNEKTTTKNRIS